MNIVKLLLLILTLLVQFACSLADVDEESDFSPTYDKLVGCWVSTENIAQEERNYEEIINEEPFSSCREICFRKDSTYTVRTKISKKTTTTFRYSDSSNVVVVNDSIAEMYGYYMNYQKVTKWGIVDDSIVSRVWVANSNTPVFFSNTIFGGTIKKDIYHGRMHELKNYYKKDYLGKPYLWKSSVFVYNSLDYHRSSQSSNCGTFGLFINTSIYTIDSLKVAKQFWR